MAKKSKPLSAEMTVRFHTMYRKALLHQRDTRDNQILTPEQADAIIAQMDAEDIRAHYSDQDTALDVYAEVATRRYRTYYPEDIENFRTEYLKSLNLEAPSWEKDTIDNLRTQFDTRYTDEAVMGLLKEGIPPIYAITKDLVTY